MPICDTLLRYAEEPSFFRMVWSPQILDEVARGLAGPNFSYTPEQVERRIRSMRLAFPEAEISFPEPLLEAVVGLPDANDRHVVAAAIKAGANAIITDNLKDFPDIALEPYGLAAQSADDFLSHQFHLNPQIAREKIQQQAAALAKPQELMARLMQLTPNFAKLLAISK